MKLITAIVNKEDSGAVCNALTKGGFSVTRLSTTGGFLMAGNMTLLIGTEDDKVDECLKLIASCAKQRILRHRRNNGVSAGSYRRRRDRLCHQRRAF